MALLKEVASIQLGYQPKVSMRGTVDGSYRIIQGKNFDAAHNLATKGLSRIFPKRRPEPYTVAKGDILFAARGMEHFAYYVDEDLPNTLASASFYIIRAKAKGLLQPYLAWWMNQGEARNHFASHGTVGTMSFISKSSLGELRIEIPPLHVQEKIAEAVRLWERERSLLERLAECRSRLVHGICMKRARRNR